MSELEKLERIKKRLEKAGRERDILTGKAESAKEELKKLGYASVLEATKALKQLGIEADKAKEQLDEAIKAFSEKYPDLVEENDRSY